MKKIGVLTSGGDAPGMNAAIRAVVKTGQYHDLQVYGINRGFEGLIDGDIYQMGKGSVSDILQRGGTILRTARSDAFKQEEGFNKALAVIKTYQLDAVIVIGGDGSLHGAQKLQRAGVATIGLPATIDNDLAYTESCIGFDTAVNTALWALGNLRDTSFSHDRINLVQVMGRRCGDIALHAAISSGAEGVLIPEKEADIEALCQKIIDRRSKGVMLNIVIIAEGYPLPMQEVSDILVKRTGAELRTTVLGYIQRGGAPSSFDRILASRLGAQAVEMLLNNNFGKALGEKNGEIICPDYEAAFACRKDVDKNLFALANILSQ